MTDEKALRRGDKGWREYAIKHDIIPDPDNPIIDPVADPSGKIVRGYKLDPKKGVIIQVETATAEGGVNGN